MKKEKVSLVRVGEAGVEAAVREALARIGGIGKFLKPGQSVMLKPNYTGNLSEDSGGVTSNAVMEAVIRILRQEGAGRIAIVEGCGTVAYGTMRICEISGLMRLPNGTGWSLRMPIRWKCAPKAARIFGSFTR